MSELEKPDLNRCQAEKIERVPMALGGTHRRTRCNNATDVIAFENSAGADGQKGSMSLCDGCAAILKEKLGDDFAMICKIKEPA